MRHLSKTSRPGWLIDEATNVVINTNEAELAMYRQSVTSAIENAKAKGEIEDLKSRIRELEDLILRTIGG